MTISLLALQIQRLLTGKEAVHCRAIIILGDPRTVPVPLSTQRTVASRGGRADVDIAPYSLNQGPRPSRS